MTDASDLKVSKQLLKTRSGEFDLASIHSLFLRDVGVCDLGCLGECVSMERLDLSHNHLTVLHKLAGLTTLHTLNLAANTITNLEGLQSLEQLQSLNLSGNLIGRFESLLCLTGLENLQDLCLQDRTNKLTNPVCQHVNYLKEVQRMFPRLTTLDGERLQGKGSELYQLCREIDTQLQQEPVASASLSAPQHPAPWLQPKDWQMADDFQNSMLCDAEEQLTDLLASCKRLSEESEEKLHYSMLGSS
ncbi:leucine-rich repeat-containing protein 61-like isoform X1 [Haliotis rufescens]|uniref:leucine-rich repeat-containing protein 61-like isoform X1 n=2 Tax=Haliotis rufescens TaxID=6454 RepID=UPI001EAFD117|nr:leucine-rich repeat-containing protein 61-like isoform X1 [Haliotis rufescens]